MQPAERRNSRGMAQFCRQPQMTTLRRASEAISEEERAAWMGCRWPAVYRRIRPPKYRFTQHTAVLHRL